MEDNELVTAATNGDVQAFSLIVEKYSVALCSVAYGVMGDFHLAQDIVQESFIKAYFKLDNLKDPQKLGSWLYAITYRKSLDWKRKQLKELHALEKNEWLNHPVSFDEMVEKREIHSEIWKALNKLGELNRIIMILFHMSGLTMENIGKLLNMSISAVESRHRRTRNLMKQELMDLLADGLPIPFSNEAMATKVTAKLIKQAGHFYIPVADRVRSSDWFVAQFGLSLIHNGELQLPSGQILYLLQVKPNLTKATAEFSIPVLSFEVEQIDVVYDRLKNSGVRLDELVKDSLTGEHFFFYDMDSNQFGIYQAK